MKANDRFLCPSTTVSSGICQCRQSNGQSRRRASLALAAHHARNIEERVAKLVSGHQGSPEELRGPRVNWASFFPFPLSFPLSLPPSPPPFTLPSQVSIDLIARVSLSHFSLHFPSGGNCRRFLTPAPSVIVCARVQGSALGPAHT